MNQSDYKKFAQVMALLQEVFVPDKSLSSMKIQVYFDVLKNHDIEKIAQAADHIIKNKKYPTFPLPAEFREALGQRDEEMIQLRALKAWENVISMSGYGQNSHGDDPLTDEAIRVAFGGWLRFGQTDPENEGYDRRHFLQCFEMLAANEQMYNKEQIETTILKELAKTRKEIMQLKNPKGGQD